MEAAQEQVDTLRDHLQEKDVERKKLEQKIQEVRKESLEAKKTLEDSLRDSNRYRCSLELLARYSLNKLFLSFSLMCCDFGIFITRQDQIYECLKSLNLPLCLNINFKKVASTVLWLLYR